MYAWGENGNGSIGDGSNTTRTTPVASTAGVSKFWVCKSYTTSVAARLSSTGSLVTWGYNNNGQCGRGDATNNKWSAGATGLTITVTDKVAWTHPSSQSSLHVVTGGTLWSCGYNGQGQLADGTNTVQYSFVASRGLMKNKIVDVTTWGAAGGCSIGVLDIDGNVYASGANDLGQLGVGNLVAKSILTKLPF
jgi:alpha-tubulin suppressor-like RCC1 family protein